MRLEGVSKSFRPGVPVLRAVDLRVGSGEIHAILGENGAGKSTLMNVLVGLVRPSSGSVAIFGEDVDPDRFGPAEAGRRGVGMVHQHSALVPAMNVVENLAFGDAGGGPWFRPRRARAAAAELAARFDLDVPLDPRVEDLSVGQRQRAEILRVLGRGARLLILDEPTAVLTPGETDRLFDSLRRLRDGGCAVIFISHKLAEVEALADRVTVLRRGRVVGVRAAGELDARSLGQLMLGREVEAAGDLPEPPAQHAPDALALVALEAPGATRASRLRGLDLTLRAGELVGVVGVDGNGQRELEEVLAGVRRPTAGRVEVAGAPVSPDPRSLRRAGVAHLSGDRESAGLVPGFSLAENWMLKRSYDDPVFAPRGWLRLDRARAETAEAVRRFGIEPPDPDLDIAALSGGNAQKLAVARELSGDPAVLVAVNPTRGLDVGAARFVHDELRARCARGVAILLVSTELDEVLGLAHRVVALVRGRLSPVSDRRDRAAIGALLLGEGAA